MTSELSKFAACLCERILSEGRVSPGAELKTRNKGRGSGNSFLRSDEVFNALALELFALQFTHNAAYRKICEVRGVTPCSISHWSEIPAVPAAAFKELELTCIPPAERTHVFLSSGTTGQRPSRHFHNAESLAVYEASLWTWLVQQLLRGLRFANYDLRLAILTPPPEQAPHSSLVHMFEIVRRKLGVEANAFIGRVNEEGSWLLDFASVTWAMECSRRDRKPMLLLGTAFSFVHLLDTLAETRIRFELPPGSRVMETGGYKGRSRSLPKAELHVLIAERLGVPLSHIICEYGMSELSSQAYDKRPEPADVGDANTLENARRQTSLLPFRGERAGVRADQSGKLDPFARHLHFPPWARAQIISPETGRQVAEGETGLIRVFDLANVFSVLAIQTEDLGIRRGVGFELIGRAELAEPRGCSLMAATE